MVGTKDSYKKSKIGEAYAFLDCDASLDEIREEMPKIRDLAETPSELEITLSEVEVKDAILIGKEKKKSKSLSYKIVPKVSVDDTSAFKEMDPRVILAYFNNPEVIGTRYMIRGVMPNATNKDVAMELASVLNVAYSSPLFESGKFWREIMYKDKRKYVRFE